MKVDHARTEKALNTYVSTLESQYKAYENLLSETSKKYDPMYSDAFVEDQKSKARARFDEQQADRYDTYIQCVNSMRECEEQNEEAIDFTDPTLQGVLTTIDALPAKTADDHGSKASEALLKGGFRVIEAALSDLRGQRNALAVVRAKLSAKGYTIPAGMEKYFYDFKMFDDLAELSNALTAKKQSGWIYMDAANKLTYIANTLGLDVSKPSLGDAAIRAAIRKGAELPDEF